MEASSAKLTWVLSYAGRCDVMVESFAIRFIETMPQVVFHGRATDCDCHYDKSGPLQKTEIGSGRAGLRVLAFAAIFLGLILIGLLNTVCETLGVKNHPSVAGNTRSGVRRRCRVCSLGILIVIGFGLQYPK
jgi:hypothetical protein